MIARHFGVFGIPRGDDVAYVLSAFRFADTGKIDGNNWPSMNLVGQLALSAPVVWAFGHRIAALQVEVAAFGVAGLFAVFDLREAAALTAPRALRRAVGRRWTAVGELDHQLLHGCPTFAFAR